MIWKLSFKASLAALTVSWGVLLACGKVSSDEGVAGVDSVDAGQDGGPGPADADLWDARMIEVEGIKRTDATGLVDPASCGAHTQCDCDEDGFASLDCPVDAGSLLSARGTPLQPGDCDDLDPLRYPGQSYVADSPPPGRNGDWNCDGVEEHWRESQVRGACIQADRSCRVGFQGFMGRVACGALGDLAECQLAPQNPEGCGPVLVGIARQPCR